MSAVGSLDAPLHGRIRATVEQYLRINLALVVVSAVVVAGLAADLGGGRWFAAFLGLLAVSGAGLLSILCSLDRWSGQRTVVVLCGLQCLTCLVSVVVEPFSLYMTPIVVTSSVLVAVPILDGRRFRRLTTAALVVIVAMSANGQAGYRAGNLHSLLSEGQRNLLALGYVPLLVGLAGYVSWRNADDLWRHNQAVARSRHNLVNAAELGRQQLEMDLLRLHSNVGELRHEVGRLQRPGDADRVLAPAAGALVAQTKVLAADVRRVSHGVFPADLAQHGLAHALAAIPANSGLAVEVQVDHDVRPPPVVESVLLAYAMHSVGTSQDPPEVGRVSWLELDVGRSASRLRVTHRFDTPRPAHGHSPAAQLLDDRIGALGGSIEVTPGRGVETTLVTVPHANAGRPEADDRQSSSSPGSLLTALRVATLFPVAGLVVVLSLYLTIFPLDDMRDVVLIIAAGFTGPCLLALPLARRWPTVGLAVLCSAYWMAAVLVVRELSFVKHFTAVALLIPLMLSLPYVSRTAFAVIAAATTVVTVVNTAIARLGQPLAIAQESPEWVNDVIGVGLLSLAAALVMTLARRDHEVLAAVGAKLLSSRRRLVQLLDETTRGFERDLHDSVQQRILSATLRLQLAALASDAGREAQQHLAVAGSELAVAEQSLADLRTGSQLRLLAGGELRDALAELAKGCPFPVSVDVTPLPPQLPLPLTSALYFCCSEGLANVAKHAGPDVTAKISLRVEHGQIQLTICDNGVGFAAAGHHHRGGLANLAERLSGLAGELSAGRAPDTGGAQLTVRLPLRPPSPVAPPNS